MIVRVRIPGNEQPPVMSDTRVELFLPPDTDTTAMSWLSRENTSYVLQISDDLYRWRNTGEVYTGNGHVISMVHAPLDAETDRMFYRLIEIRSEP